MLTALNDGPTLTGFGPSVTFTQTELNVGPQIIDGDVAFDDPEDNFNGGSLVLAGLLAEDIVSIRNQGFGAGEIGFAPVLSPSAACSSAAPLAAAAQR